MELSIIMPCLNEALTVGTCITKARDFLDREKIEGEIIVADNGSTDGSIEIAEQLGARVVHVPERGYGRALSYGIHESRGTFVIMGDSDDSYDFSGLAPFVAKLREGYDLVMGNRFLGGIAPKAMPFMHRYVGNPMLSALGRSIYKAKVCGDFYCGLRGFRKSSIERLHLQSSGMEFALEMVIKSALHFLKIAEVPTTLSPDGRDRAPHLRTYRDGWRSLRLYLLMSPRWIFGFPAMALITLGTIALLGLTLFPDTFNDTLSATTTIFSGCLIALGYQALLLGIFAKLIAVEVGLHPPDLQMLWIFQKQKSLEWMLISGALVAAAGIAFGILVSILWHRTGGAGVHELGALLRLIVLATTGILIGGQTMLASFTFGLLHLLAQRRQFRWKRREDVGAKWGRRKEDPASPPTS